ncbi:Isoprenylcysteine carboxyl methyltransferase family-domain-containing protein [Kalaharituber pfeilii]|nr:Isoprenylcysteine carboxyl methyltransferase family-domain-containing protein [Kalaharituber pfeilii]
MLHGFLLPKRDSSTTIEPSMDTRPDHRPAHHTPSPVPTSIFNVYPGESHSLSGIALRAACLGFAMGASLLLAVTCGYFQLPFFFFLLALFHFLEFWTTARYNTTQAKTKAFLLTSNGSAYNAAHLTATLESLLELYFFPNLKPRLTFSTYLGLLLVLLGQTTRTLAMVHAGTNFNHNVQRRRQPGHVLVKHGIYAYLRHPSYFGFWWWGLGTQLMLANPISFTAYAVVLWRFFRDRIEAEEMYLISFFGQSYKDYKAQTRVGIPFIN